jgi:Coenzyme PQQ synthesis protein D (PqqD)
MNDDSLIMRRGDLVASATDDGAVVLDVATGALYGLNATAALIWAAIEQPTALRAIVRDLGTRFEAEEATIRQDVVAALIILMEQGIVAIG